MESSVVVYNILQPFIEECNNFFFFFTEYFEQKMYA